MNNFQSISSNLKSNNKVIKFLDFSLTKLEESFKKKKGAKPGTAVDVPAPMDATPLVQKASESGLK